ncbi:hypothetical protein KMC90_gp02 [Lactococcus phage vB_Llc_bIBBAm4]|uniref:Uncharacterized protein n=1 Tax=Lactococcus phage vB_Llc_bIBBAm4 TaxID=2305485 RepID=A0A678VFL5_9CAUD|nr:hypothetical protein KMC90_gp02 [Lactococcus phage vB_Llc_bIBBAm4]AXY83698.1 hypothetical protein bIBBAm4_gp37 [Lactococcus phage vB_Llc_bIBBAm4]
MKLKNQIGLLNNTLKLHDEKVDEHFPTDEKKIPAYAKAQYMDLFSMLQEIAKAYEFIAKFHKPSVKALDILVTNLNEHSEMVNEIMDKTNYKTWTKQEDEHYTGVFYYDLHRTVEETIEEMKEV